MTEHIFRHPQHLDMRLHGLEDGLEDRHLPRTGLLLPELQPLGSFERSKKIKNRMQPTWHAK